ncbi:peptidase S8 and S53 subtilisin kexin sedolisin [Haloterrigena turkmenica DSM 5511]|uniref:Peptidase S8 and S53 subtilisin kexin sedolisin n=1 Tax=Haloterrigena turkmenica (strain ATCC 51198 / DSM 5511 / JCM 9101 / NCIMB 13204 / VKM B-1734 / 4k) TaxID=543526 RepID=D2RT55_HALTV|nr:S8 family serine peptidase [Haloterrigena turkmenica]ADB60935.1 peptidase S8 and S53 subtilisin kexin sedolisin [Haloterrigena turkmenica DSM 5511]
MPQSGPPDEDADDGYDRRTVLTGAGTLAAGGLIGSSGVASATPEREPGPKKDELVVGISASAPDVAREARAAVPGDADVVHANETIRYATISFPSETPAHARERFIEAIERAEHVEYVERNATVQSFGEPDDTYYGYQSAPQQVNCEAAWGTTTGSEDVCIATIDQGVQYDHPDLESAVDDRVGEDVAGRGSDPYPSDNGEQHGTHVAGIAIAETDNGRGTAGISDCSLLAVRALDANGQGSLSDIADGIQWAADAGADVINLSLGASDDYRTLTAACEYAEEQGALVVGAAGNAGDDGVAYPAAYEDVIGVSALEGESLADFSNTGPEIDLAAPGAGLVSTVPWGDYGRMTGTSMATPVVAGVAGLALSAHPDLSPLELREHLTTTATDLGLEASAQGAGRVDAAAAVETDPYPDQNADESEDTDESGECGDETVVASADGSLSGGWWGESDRYMYRPRTSDPCSATLSLEGPSGGDFDLYLNVDGESPTRWDHDESSAGDGASEAIELALSGDEDLRIQVHANTGNGSYTLRIEERGR